MLSERPAFIAQIHLAGRGGCVPLLQWAPPDFGNAERQRLIRKFNPEIRENRNTGVVLAKYLCYLAHDGGPLIAQASLPSVTIPHALANDILEAFRFGAVRDETIASLRQALTIAIKTKGTA